MISEEVGALQIAEGVRVVCGLTLYLLETLNSTPFSAPLPFLVGPEKSICLHVAVHLSCVKSPNKYCITIAGLDRGSFGYPDIISPRLVYTSE